MFKKVILLSIAIAFLSTPVSIACEADSDCNDGAICMKTSADYHGYCFGGADPTYFNNPPYDQTRGTPGDLCDDDSGCGLDGHCIIPNGQEYGYCY